jgi:hypothetical protein
MVGSQIEIVLDAKLEFAAPVRYRPFYYYQTMKPCFRRKVVGHSKRKTGKLCANFTVKNDIAKLAWQKQG